MYMYIYVIYVYINKLYVFIASLYAYSAYKAKNVDIFMEQKNPIFFSKTMSRNRKRDYSEINDAGAHKS